MIGRLTGSAVAPPVVDSADVLDNPEATLTSLCEALDIPFDRAMLSWAQGLRDTDGIWGSHWYDAVASSTGFGPPDNHPLNLTAEEQAVADACRPDYERLSKYALRGPQ